ncbi:hypothetical protein GCM10022223_33490 [Kineosporia mesophila]|uniref:Membrane-anchored protein n=1 Tax=Kineosporia mesophila TaxID=566012 RepID=A0ABP6ZNT2_9ACTN|nr:hypothetical protein [Kineosporia mesophila]MCD5353666.1 hypothetical protein [Kineosporia mesophila]
MTTYRTPLASRTDARQLLNKVPEITIWFWIIKILCTTVGESFADWINMTLGVGLTNTALMFTVVLAVILAVQLRLSRYVPAVYWLTVVVVSITGTLYTDILTDSSGVPLKVSTSIFAAVLAVVFGIWYARERTLSIHTIVTLPREAFYWLAVLVTFALGTAAGDWTLELTGWGPGKSVLLPAGLIAIVAVCWRAGAQPVLAFWLAYILTRPLGANIGDFLALPKAEQGLGLGTALTSVLFLAAIAATVIYLTRTRADIITHEAPPRPANPRGERMALGVYVIAAVSTAVLLHHTSGLPHTSPLAEGEGPAVSTVQLTPAQATAKFPSADIATLKSIGQDLQAKVAASDQAGALTRAKDLETTWDQYQPQLQPLDGTAWTFIDVEIDHVLTAVRSPNPDPKAETAALSALVTTLS